MIFANIKDLATYNFLGNGLKECFKFFNSNNLIDFEKGTHTIDGDNIFVNIVEYETTSKENRFWEAHRKYLDLHIMLNGKERIELNFIHNMNQKEYIIKDDFVPLEGNSNSHVILQKEDFLICYPNDAHMTALKVENSITIKKAIFKILI